VTGVLHIVLARKPIEGTIAENCLRWGCGALNIQGCRIGTEENQSRLRGTFPYSDDSWGNGRPNEISQSHPFGRWPANLIVGGEEVAEGFPANAPSGGITHQPRRTGYSGFSNTRDNGTHVQREADSGSASRFFFNFAEQESDE
jgi:site-specific DNA-methyltransferase (adenine-specific)